MYSAADTEATYASRLISTLSPIVIRLGRGAVEFSSLLNMLSFISYSRRFAFQSWIYGLVLMVLRLLKPEKRYEEGSVSKKETR